MHDVGLGHEIREDVDRRIGDQQRLGVGGHVEHKDMAHAALCAQTVGFVHHGAHDLIGVKRAFHDGLRLSFTHQAHGGFGAVMAVGGVDDRAGRDVEIVLRSGGLDPVLRANQQRGDQAFFQRCQRTGERGLIHRVDHGCGDWVQRRGGRKHIVKAVLVMGGRKIHGILRAKML